MGGPMLGEKSDAGYTASGFTSDWKSFQGKRVRITIEEIEEKTPVTKEEPVEEDPFDDCGQSYYEDPPYGCGGY